MKKEEQKKLTESVTTLTKLVEKLRSEKYLQMIEDKKKFLFYNFLTGIARGVGFAIGTTIIVALLIWLLSQLVDIPVVGDWIRELLDYIEN